MPALPVARARQRELTRASLGDRFVGDAGDRLGAEAFEQHRLGLRARQAARLEIEGLLGIERGDRRAVTAEHVVGEDLEFGLGVHLRLGREQDRLRLHRAVGLLRAALDDDLALENADALVGDDGAIEFAADPMGRGVNHLQRRVGAIAAIDQREAAEIDLRLVARLLDEQLTAVERPAGDQREGGKFGALRQFAGLGLDMQPGVVPDRDDMGDFGARRDSERGRDVALRRRAGAEEATRRNSRARPPPRSRAIVE